MFNQTLSLFLSLVISPSAALGQIMLYVDGMNGLISHNETVQWLYSLVGSKVKNNFSQDHSLSSTVYVL